jgi:5-formyltetrahydrofolate cyclo-ligase
MKNKDRLRKKYFFIRKKKYFEIKPTFFNPLIKLIKKKYKKKIINISSYYPTSFEANVLKLDEIDIINKFKILLPVLKGGKVMHFHEWKNNDVLQINHFGMLEPILVSSHVIPDIMLVPLLAYDNQNNRLGYGGGFYDRYLNKYLNTHNNILTIGIAFSFQKHHKIPTSNKDVKLNYILTEKGIYQ